MKKAENRYAVLTINNCKNCWAKFLTKCQNNVWDTFPILSKWSCCSADSKRLRHFFGTLLWIFLNDLLIIASNCSLSRLHIRPLPFLSSRLWSTLRNFWKHFYTVQSLVYPSPHALLILATVLEALCLNLNSCKISKQRSCFFIFIIKSVYSLKIFLSDNKLKNILEYTSILMYTKIDLHKYNVKILLQNTVLQEAIIFVMT